MAWWSSFDTDEDWITKTERRETHDFWLKYFDIDLVAKKESDVSLKYMNIDDRQKLVNDDKPEYEDIYNDEDDCNDESYPDGQELVNNDEHEYEEVHDDHDDNSNDENNWRNDYPAEDPRFFENDDAAIYCRDVDGYDLSSDEEDYDYVYGSELPRRRCQSYYSYYRLVRQWMEEYHSTTEDEEDMTEESQTEDEENMTEESHSTTEDEEDWMEECHSTTEDEEDEDAK